MNEKGAAVNMKFPRLQGLSSCRLIDNLDLKQDDDDKNVLMRMLVRMTDDQ